MPDEHALHTPAKRLMPLLCGPPTFTTTGASMRSPPASDTPDTHPLERSIPITSLWNLKVAP